ncbi:hypothetical protein IFM89_006021 [Coptis chinensis]|uniref:Uncharacterized protein n=1 Tax=Coptis chinensis TaxID=261450 RepID=A0A835LYR9_9MAGN|nr:hypothetical protein IFM89_006021 [Coptis chinensis]
MRAKYGKFLKPMSDDTFRPSNSSFMFNSIFKAKEIVATEDLYHLFLLCSWSKGIWFLSSFGLRTEVEDFDKINWLSFCMNLKEPTDIGCFNPSMLLCAIMDAIWQARNKKRFQGAMPSQQNSKGFFLGEMVSKVKATSLGEAEVLASELAVKFAMQKQWKEAILEGDAKIVIQACGDIAKASSWT